jgi:2'-5' RNA ligase
VLRLFAGLEIPETVRARLDALRQPLPGAKWVEPQNFHITLRFAGDIDNRTAEEFAGFLSEIPADPFEIRLSDLGAFGGREPRSLWVGVDGGEPLAALQRATERAARSAGLPPDGRNHKPHVTIARLRGTRPDTIARFLGSCGAFCTEPFIVTRFVLFSARPRVGGGPYVVEEAFPLGGWDIEDDV